MIAVRSKKTQRFDRFCDCDNSFVQCFVLFSSVQDFIIIVIGACEDFASWCSSCSCHDNLGGKGSIVRRRAVDKQIRSSTSQTKRSRVEEPKLSALHNCKFQGRRASEFASGKFHTFCVEDSLAVS